MESSNFVILNLDSMMSHTVFPTHFHQIPPQVNTVKWVEENELWYSLLMPNIVVFPTLHVYQNALLEFDEHFVLKRCHKLLIFKSFQLDRIDKSNGNSTIDHIVTNYWREGPSLVSCVSVAMDFSWMCAAHGEYSSDTFYFEYYYGVWIHPILVHCKYSHWSNGECWLYSSPA